MKKTYKISVAALALCVPIAAVPAGAYETVAETVAVGGGTDKVRFEEKNMRDFDLYAEFDQSMYMLDNRLYAPVLTESKAVYKHGTYTDVEVSVDVTAIGKSGNIDGGIYVQASGATNAHDGITAWNVNVEHDVNSNVFALKLHRFDGGSWRGAQKEAYNIEYTSDTVHLKVAVKSGVLYAYLDGNDPVFTHHIGTVSGKVGLRAYYAPIYFENFSVTSPMISVEPKLLESKLTEFDGFDYAPYTEGSANTLKDAIERGKTALVGQSQADIDKAYADIESAYSELIKEKTRSELDVLVAEAQNAIAATDVYTKSSISSLRVVVSKCEAAEDDDVSYWYKILRHRLDSVVKYEISGDDNE